MNCWHCFGDCNSGGSILDFVSRMEKVSLREAALMIQQWSGIQTVSGRAPRNGKVVSPSKDARESEEVKQNPPLPFVLNDLDANDPYLYLRGLLPETIASFGIGYCTKGLMAGRIAIPIHDTLGRIVAYAGRWPGTPPEDEPKYLLPRGFRKSLELFNYHRAVACRSDAALVIVEGFFGCMKVWHAGFPCVVAIMGSSLSEAQESLIVKAAGSDRKVLLMFDEDGAGRAGREKTAVRLARSVQVRLIELEVEGAQPDHLPVGEIRALIEDASRNGKRPK
jgi:DNA primase